MFKATLMYIKKDKLLINLKCIALTSVAGTDILFRSSPDIKAPYAKLTFHSNEAADAAMKRIEDGVEANVLLITFGKGA